MRRVLYGLLISGLFNFNVCAVASLDNALPALAKLGSPEPLGSIKPPQSDAEKSWHEFTQNFIQAYSKGDYVSAQYFVQRAFEVAREAFGKDHPYMADTLNKLGVLLELDNELEDAKTNYQLALRILEKHYGPDHPDVATALNNLANVALLEEHYSTAEALHLRALKIRSTAYGMEHSSVAQSAYNLALLYEKSERLAEAQMFYRQALMLWEKSVGPTHINVANTLVKLAAVYAQQGNEAGAEELHLRALKIRESNLGPKHMSVAESLVSLGAICAKLSKYQEAGPFLKQALDIMEEELGANDPQVAATLYSLANVYHIQAKNEEAYSRELEKRPLAGTDKSADAALNTQRREAFGAQIALRRQFVREIYAKAEPLYQRSLSIFTAVFGEGHPTSVIIKEELAMLHNSIGVTHTSAYDLKAR